MIIIRMSGGIGNQMFQYALYLKLISLGKDVKFDDVTEYELSNARPVVLSVFGIEYPKASKEEIAVITDGSMRLADRIRRKMFGRKSKEYHECAVDYDKMVLQLDTAYLCGCFQSERYFKDIETIVRETYRFRNVGIPSEIAQSIEEYGKQIEEGCAVSLHIRRGDYLKAEDVYGGICTDAYYNSAIERILETYPEAHFFIFTNDTFWAEKWCEARENAGHFTVIKGTDENTGFIDMMLMSKCRHHIIANSSFSWWGAWLGECADKTIIAPAKWLNTNECRGIYTEDMIRINEKGRLEEQ